MIEETIRESIHKTADRQLPGARAGAVARHPGGGGTHASAAAPDGGHPHQRRDPPLRAPPGRGGVPAAGGALVPGAVARDPAAAARPHQGGLNPLPGSDDLSPAEENQPGCHDGVNHACIRTRAGFRELRSCCWRRLGCAAAGLPDQPVLKDYDPEQWVGTPKSGLRVIVQEDHSSPLVTVVSTFGVGATSDPKGVEGLAHFVEHLVFRSQPGRRRAASTGTSSSGWAATSTPPPPGTSPTTSPPPTRTTSS